MKAWRVHRKGHYAKALSLEEVAPPEPGPGEARIRVRAGTVNFADILLCQGTYQDRPPVPFTPGLETSGVVEDVGPGVGLAVGEHVAAMSALPAGGFAEQALVRAQATMIFPRHIPFSDVTVLYSTYQTAHVALHHRGRLRTGEWLLVLAGASGVGSAAVQLGAAAGAQVIATAGSAAKLDLCRRIGAAHVIDHRTEDVAQRLGEITVGRGVDVVFDPVGGALAEAVRRRLAWEGRYLVIGFAAGQIPTFPANHVLVKNYTVLGVHWSAYTAHDRPIVEAAHRDIVDLYDRGLVRPVVARTVGLDDVPQALAALEARDAVGRLVLVP
jgi:NADPH2:quinone reductase